MKTFRLLFLILLVLTTFVSCTPEAPFAEFEPAKESNFKIAFFYPKHWKWELTPGTGRDMGIMYVLDPDSDPNAKDVDKMVVISVILDSPQRRMQESISLLLRDTTTLSGLKLLNNKIVQIDGRNARWITYRREPIAVHGETQPYIIETVFLFAEDRYYDISISILEDEVNGKYYTDFIAMVESIKILP